MRDGIITSSNESQPSLHIDIRLAAKSPSRFPLLPLQIVSLKLVVLQRRGAWHLQRSGELREEARDWQARFLKCRAAVSSLLDSTNPVTRPCFISIVVRVSLNPFPEGGRREERWEANKEDHQTVCADRTHLRFIPSISAFFHATNLTPFLFCTEVEPGTFEEAQDEGEKREIGKLAVWSVTSAKPGNGVELMRDDSLETYWQ
jgi:hypothetical protein